MDSPNVDDISLRHMLSLVEDNNSNDVLDMHLIDGFDDSSSKNACLAYKSNTKLDRYSYSLCAKIIETVRYRIEKFQIQIFHVLKQNTRWDLDGIALPFFSRLMVETSTMSNIPANFVRMSRCLDEVVRRIRVTTCYDDPNWESR
ncbi:N-terminal asparagine amidohydrolase, partial [Olea europaea subsp. europaea]